jgi:DNA-binding NarL/FixJ family response regulator
MGSPSASDDTARLTVVCIDDDPSVIDLLQHAVEDQADFEIVAATTKRRDFDPLVTEHRPDVVIVDQVLRDSRWERAGRHDPAQLQAPMSGLELVERARSVVPEATIVLFTARAGLEEASRDVGADVYVEKPHIDALWPAIREARVRH